MAEHQLAHAGGVEFADDRGRPGIEPEPGRCDGLAVRVHQPGAVALAGDRERQGAAAEIWDQAGKIAQYRGRLVPGPRHVLLDAAAGQVDIVVRSPGHRDLGPVPVEGHGLDHRGAGVDTDNDLPAHAAAASLAWRP